MNSYATVVLADSVTIRGGLVIELFNRVKPVRSSNQMSCRSFISRLRGSPPSPRCIELKELSWPETSNLFIDNLDEVRLCQVYLSRQVTIDEKCLIFGSNAGDRILGFQLRKNDDPIPED